MPVLSNPSPKGGVGKSTLIQYLAEALAELGQRVLCVDFDPQGNLSRRLDVPWDPETNTSPYLSEILRADPMRPVQPGSAGPAIQPCGWNLREYPFAERIDVLPAREDLENRDTEAASLGAVTRLQQSLHGITSLYDWTLIDCRPSLGHLVQQVMVATDFAVLSVNADNDAITAAAKSQQFMLANAQVMGNPGLRVAGVVTNEYRVTTSLNTERFENTMPQFFTAEQIWEPVIPLAVSIANAIDRGIPILPNVPKALRDRFMAHGERLVKDYGA